MKDLFGKAMLDYQTHNSPENIVTETNISEPDEMSISYLFRSYNDMPVLEQKALSLAYGKVLDVGCGAGSHALYLQNHKNLEVMAIDISAQAIETCKLRGLKNVQIQNILHLENSKFDTILLLMNGTGIFQSLDQISHYLNKLKSLLNPKGQILIDSSDIIYMYDDHDDGSKWIPMNDYYGELVFTISYKNQKEIPFKWLYLDYNTFQNAAHDKGFKIDLVQEGTHYDYLARLTLD